MRGITAILAFIVMGVLTVSAAWDTRLRIGFLCGDKNGCHGPIPQSGNAAADLGSLVGLIAVGLIGLLTIMLVGNGVLRLLRTQRK